MATTQVLEVEGGTARLVLPSGHPVLIDAADVPLVERYRWCVQTRPHTCYARGYLIGDRKSGYVQMHRLLLGAPSGLDVDHRNHDGLDNRRANLRLATRLQNNANRVQAVGKSGYRGVTWNQASGRWQARVWIDNKCRHVGLFDDAWEAAQAYNEAALATWGEFAKLNVRHESAVA